MREEITNSKKKWFDFRGGCLGEVEIISELLAYFANNCHPFNYFNSAEEGRSNETVIAHIYIYIYLNENGLGNG